jgi:hypothetical protein
MRRWGVMIACLAFALPLAASSDAVTFSVASVDMDDITGPIRLHLHLHSDPASDLIYKIDVRLDPELVDGRQIPKPVLTDYTRDDFDFEVPAPTTGRWSFDSLFFHSRPLKGAIVLSYALRDERFDDGQLVAFTVTPRGPIAGVIAGGVIGVLVILLFRFTYLLARPHTARLSLGAYASHAWRSFVLGVIVVSIFVVILRGYPAFFDKLPIAVDVKDAYGGFIVGLFFEPLARYLATYVTAASRKAAPLTPPSETPA